jgi:hypothetical protein
MEAKILKKISSSGPDGIKRIILKKTFGKDCDNVLTNLIEKKQIFVEKKGNAYYVWTQENYALKLSQNKSKIKIIENGISKLESKNITINRNSNLQNTIQISLQAIPDIEFKIEFDRCLTAPYTSIGWMPFSQIRKKICESKNISSDQFYNLASELVERHRENYEISSGGKEGIMIRGLMHGFVRNV